MLRSLAVIGVLFLFGLTAQSQAPKARPAGRGLRLEGVWAFQSLKNLTNGKTITGRTGYLIFSKRYFSVVIAADQRKKLAPEQDLKDLGKEDLLDLLQITAGAGEYKIEGTTLVIKTLTHLRPETIGTGLREEITLAGDTLKLTYPALVTTSMYAKGDRIESTFQRVE